MSFEIIDQSAHTVGLQQAILLYGSRPHAVEYATLHSVVIGDDNAPVIGAGKPMTRNTLRTIERNLAKSTRRKGVLPANILSVGVDHMIWYVPASQRTMYFDCHDGIGQCAGSAPQPGLIFAVGPQTWCVYAIKETGRPTEDTPLFHAPYMNVWRDGRICVGSTPIPGDNIADAVDQWTAAFFASNFSHTNHEETVKYKGGCHAFWRDALAGQFKRFPNRVLVPSGVRRLGDLLNLMDN